MKRLSPILSLLVLAVLAVDGICQEPAKRLAVPPAAKLAEVTSLVREVFKEDFAAAKTPAARKKLAQLLAKQASETQDDAAGRFVLLTEARKQAVGAGEIELGLQLADQLAANFEVEPLPLKREVLTAAAAEARTPAEHKEFAVQAAAVIEQAVADDQYETAVALAKLASQAARSGKDFALASKVLQRSKQLDELATAYADVAAARERLTTAPTDADANLTVGRYLCFQKGDFQRGLPMLALGSDADLKSLAAADLAGTKEYKDQVRLGDRWWDLANKSKEKSHQRWLQTRAGTWYRQAQPKLTGLNKVKVEKRLAAVKDLPTTDDAPGLTGIRSSTINLIELLAPQTDFHPKDKWAVQDGTLHCTKQHFVPKVVFPYEPPEEYDVKFVFSQPKLRNGVGVILPIPGREESFMLGVAGGSGREVFFMTRELNQKVPNAYQANVKYTVELKVRKDRFEASVNGKPIFKFQPNPAAIAVGSWHKIKESSQVGLFADDPTVFHEITLTEVTGQGKLLREKQQ